jgi:hypothetical protein
MSKKKTFFFLIILPLKGILFSKFGIYFSQNPGLFFFFSLIQDNGKSWETASVYIYKTRKLIDIRV